MQMKINLNADIAEGYGKWTMGNDQDIINEINSANIACGKHAGDENIMCNTVNSCKQNNVDIGVHPGFSDIEGFGRRRLNISEKNIENLIAYQTGALIGIATMCGAKVTHMKPHGALNNIACEDLDVAKAIVRGFKSIDESLILLAPTYSKLIKAGENFGIKCIEEGFADRAYMSDGSLSSRNIEGSVITDINKAVNQAIEIASGEKINTIDGGKIHLPAKSICIHGDKPEALHQAQSIKSGLIDKGFDLVGLSQL